MLDRGLSLCIQGTCALLNLRAPGPRFIPVHTGNITPLWDLKLSDTVYPCAYREHIRDNILIVITFGLSLCIQGTFELTV